MALNYLSRRDYSAAELKRRLLHQGGDAVAVDQVLAWCKTENYLNEQRYLQMLVSSRANKGYGLNYIVQQCKLQNINQQQVVNCAAELRIDWFALALQQYQKKYGDSAVTEYKERLKRMAYLQRRGFNCEQIQFAINHTE